MFVSNTQVVFNNLSLNASTYSWNFGNLGISILAWPKFDFPADISGNYTVCLHATNEFGCIDSTCHDIFIYEDPVLYLPNSFTPDGDGINDFFGPIGFSMAVFEMRVFDRWGEVIYTWSDLTGRWDGTFRTVPAKEDVYGWKIVYATLKNPHVNREIQGHVTLLR